MFGIGHCIYYHCLINGSNDLEKSDACPLYLCPVDLRKLHHAVGFEPNATEGCSNSAAVPASRMRPTGWTGACGDWRANARPLDVFNR